uniref:Uncharacterized protein n=1 Tax=Parascaris equorum TaxID=6256 RepID=A0A914R5Q3_PAREQ
MCLARTVRRLEASDAPSVSPPFTPFKLSAVPRLSRIFVSIFDFFLVCKLENLSLERFSVHLIRVIFTTVIINLQAGTSPCKLASENGLRLLVLNHNCIDRVGDETRFISLGFQADFAWNSLSEWSEVGTLLRLPNLHTLNLSHNPLKSDINANLPIAPFLQTLIINDTNLRLSAIRVFLESAP